PVPSHFAPSVADDGAEPLPPPARRSSLLAVALGNFMVQMAMMPVSAILPTIAADFGVELGTVSWVMSAYLLMLTGWLLAPGRRARAWAHLPRGQRRLHGRRDAVRVRADPAAARRAARAPGHRRSADAGQRAGHRRAELPGPPARAGDRRRHDGRLARLDG